MVVFEVPQMAPMEVAMESANRALSILEEKPEPFSRAFSSSAEKMPVRRPVPMKVPMVSKVSDMENAKMVSRMIGSFDTSENSAGKPSLVKITPKVCGSWAKVSAMDTELAMVVWPIGMPTTAVTAMAISMPPRTLSTVSTMASTRPMVNSQMVGLFMTARPGVACTVSPLLAADLVVKVKKPTLRKPT